MPKYKTLVKSHVSVALGCFLVLGALLVTTDPLKLPLILLLVPFMIFFIGLRSLLILLVGKWYSVASSRKINVVSTGCTGVIVFVLVLQSLGQLSWRDILLTLSLILVTGFYFSKVDLL